MPPKPTTVLKGLKNPFFLTLNAHIFQSLWSNFLKLLPHDLRQVKYKIMQFDSKKNILFGFLDEHNKNGSFECFLIEKWPLVL